MNNKQKRLLCIVGGMNPGGAETFLMKIYRELNKEKYQMDFLVNIQENGFYDKEIYSMGGRVYQSTPKTKGFIKSVISIITIVKENNYQYVMRVSQHSLSAIDLVAAKIGGAKILVYRSSNSNTGGGSLNRILHYLFKWIPKVVPTIKIAPSTEAAKFMFGNNCVRKKRAIILKNAIPIHRFIFNNKKREMIGEELQLNNKFVVGHVGRFSKQKNHSFLIDVFAEIEKKHKNSLLLLVGEGELEQNIKEKINKLCLTKKVILTGARTDVENILMAMDVLIFPSFFEGMPNVVIEAQATGLPCIISDTITKDVKITDLVTFLSIKEKASLWANKALAYNKSYQRKDMSNVFNKSGYNIKNVTREFEKIIFE